MKKLFGRTRRSDQEWDAYDEGEYDWDRDEEERDVRYSEDGEAYYSGDEEACYGEDGEAYYSEDEEAYRGEDEGAFYTEDGEVFYTEEGNPDYIEEDNVYEAEEIPSEEGDPYYALEQNGYFAEDEGGYVQADDLYSAGEDNDGYDGYDTIDQDFDRADMSTGRNRKEKRNAGIWSDIRRVFASMSGMDRMIMGTGAAVLVLAAVVAGILVSSKIADRQVADFVSVGAQLENIDTIGGAGLLAITDAQAAKFAGLNPADGDGEGKDGYDEEEYSQDVTVVLELVSIQRDLKIKFVNEKTNKLIANVPFAVNVKDPDGKSFIWSDDDMDGVIYKKDITPGKYQIVMEPLKDEKYAKYAVSTVSEPVEVRKNIEYKKVNVANEIKSEDEVNVSQEDTKINETVVESSLNDTVAWVESSVVAASYNEVPKSSIPDPMTLVSLDKTFVRASSVSGGNGKTDLQLELKQPHITVDAGQSFSLDAVAKVINPPKNAKVTYSISGGDTAIASVAINSGSGKITGKGVKAGTTKFSVKASCNGVTATAGLTVTVNPQKTISLDKTTASVFIDVPITLTATVSNTDHPAVTAVSSDTNVATVSVNGNKVTVNGVRAGQAVITVSYTVPNGEPVSAGCVVVVKNHPKNDTSSPLKDSYGNQLYVFENDAYREAHYADFYTAEKFYLMGEAKYTGWQTLEGKVYFFRADGTKVTGEQVIQGAKYNFASDGSLVTGSGALGIDVSKWNGNIDWNAVKNSGINYVIIRCGYRGSSAGSLIADPKFTSNIKGATAAGLKVGVYFFTQAVDEREAVEEASMVLEQIKNYTISYPVFLDVEASGGRADKIDKATRTAVCKAFCQTIQNAGYNAGIYANKSWLNTKLDPGSLSAYKIWLAQYAASPTYTGRYDLWQYRSTGKVNGISGNVDMDLSYLGY